MYLLFVEIIRSLLNHNFNLFFQYDKPKELSLPESLTSLSENLDVIVSLAERHYYNCDFRECYKITTK